jgi:hypothetical protein
MSSHLHRRASNHHGVNHLETGHHDAFRELLNTLESEVILLNTISGIPQATQERLGHLVALIQNEYDSTISTARLNPTTTTAGGPEQHCPAYSPGVMAPSSSTIQSPPQAGAKTSRPSLHRSRVSHLQQSVDGSRHPARDEETPISERRVRSSTSATKRRSSGSTTVPTLTSDEWSLPAAVAQSQTEQRSSVHEQLNDDHSHSENDDVTSIAGGVMTGSAIVSPRSVKAARSPRSIVPISDGSHHRKLTTSSIPGGLARMGSRKSLIPTLPQAHPHSGRPTSSPNNNGSMVSSHGYSYVPAAPPPSTFGHCLTAAVHMSLEALLVSCEAERLALYTKTPNGASLELAIAVGAGVPPARKGVIASPVGLIQAVFSTCIAANLDAVTYEDVSECPGPTTAKNALLFPVVYSTPAGLREPQGVIILINKRHGQQPFGTKEEYLLNMRLPMLSYQLWRYPLEHAAFTFDAAPLHRLAPLPTYIAPSIGIPKELSEAPDHVQKVYHRNGAEKFIRRQALVLTDDIVQAPSTAESVSSVEAYISVLEDCWKRGIHDRIEVELTLRQKMQHLSDAREILVRKQRKFDILKETLCEQLESNLAAVGGGGGQSSSSDPSSRRMRRR